MAKTEQNRGIPPLVWAALVAVILVAAVFGVRYLTREKVPVIVRPVSYQTISSTVPTNGKVEPVVPYQAHAPAAGIVQKIYVELGQQVQKGDLLISMNDADAQSRVASARASLSAARLTLDDMQHGGSYDDRSRNATDITNARNEQQQATRNLETLKNLQQHGAAAQGELTVAQQRLDTADFSLKNAVGHNTSRFSSQDLANQQAHVADAAANLAAAQNAVAGLNIRSPFAGTVYSIPVSPYDFVRDSDDLLDVADLNHVQIRAYFDEPEIGGLVNGQSVKIIWEAKPGKEWHGHLLRAPTTVIPYGGTRNVGEAIISVDDARGDLQPNADVTVTVTESERVNVLSVPREAVHTDGPKDYVYRIINGKLSSTPVEVGTFNLTNEEIRSGLTDKDVVVLGPATSGVELTNGLAVKIVK